MVTCVPTESVMTNYSSLYRCFELERLRRPPITNIEDVRRNRLFWVAAAILAMLSQAAASQTLSFPRAANASTEHPSIESICSAQTMDSAKAALQLVCQ